MKGLLIKDLQLIFSNKMIIPIIIFITTILLINGDGEALTYVIVYFTIMCGMMVINTISYDDLDHSGAFLMTMPITRKLYVLEKYMFMFAGFIVGWFVSFMLCNICSRVRHLPIVFTDLLFSSLTTVMLMCILLLIMIPVQLKFGNEKSRIFMIVLGVGFMVVFYLSKSIIDMLHMDVQTTVNRFNQFFTEFNIPTLVVILAAIVLSITLVSMQISFNIVRKKQY